MQVSMQICITSDKTELDWCKKTRTSKIYCDQFPDSGIIQYREIVNIVRKKSNQIYSKNWENLSEFEIQYI